MSYFTDIEKHINNTFKNYASATTLPHLPTGNDLEKMQMNQLHKVDFIAVAVDVLDFKKMNTYTNNDILNAIMNEFFFGVTKILKLIPASKIDIQGDGMFAIYPIKTRHDVVQIFNILCSLNTFREHLKKKVNIFFDNKIKKELTTYWTIEAEFEFGIGASYSFDNYISKVGDKDDNDLIFMGHAVNCANELAKNANRDTYPPILVDNIFQYNLTDEQKKEIANDGGARRFNDPFTYSEAIYGFDWVINKYNNFVKNNI